MNKKPTAPGLRTIREGQQFPDGEGRETKKRDHFRCETLLIWGMFLGAVGLAAISKLTTEYVALCSTMFGLYKGLNSKNLKEKLCNSNNRQEKGEL